MPIRKRQKSHKCSRFRGVTPGWSVRRSERRGHGYREYAEVESGLPDRKGSRRIRLSTAAAPGCSGLRTRRAGWAAGRTCPHTDDVGAGRVGQPGRAATETLATLGTHRSPLGDGLCHGRNVGRQRVLLAVSQTLPVPSAEPNHVASASAKFEAGVTIGAVDRKVLQVRDTLE